MQSDIDRRANVKECFRQIALHNLPTGEIDRGSQIHEDLERFEIAKSDKAQMSLTSHVRTVRRIRQQYIHIVIAGTKLLREQSTLGWR